MEINNVVRGICIIMSLWHLGGGGGACDIYAPINVLPHYPPSPPYGTSWGILGI